MSDHLSHPETRSWDDMKGQLGFTEAERAEIDDGARRMADDRRRLR